MCKMTFANTLILNIKHSKDMEIFGSWSIYNHDIIPVFLQYYDLTTFDDHAWTW